MMISMARTAARRLRQRLAVPFALAATMLIAGCASPPRIPYGVEDASASRVLDVSNLRRFADEPASAFRNDDRQAALSVRGPRTYLALSGGGADGAYGAGVLNGWSESGRRPSFSIVSGVSTGALIAPFAFLGSGYDHVLREVYTSGVAATLVESPNPLNAIFGSGLFGNRRLRDLVAQYVDADLMAAVAFEHAKGRMLLIVTTDLDSQRTVIWDMGRIASVATAEALKLFRDVMTASASIPIVFSPMMVSASANGRRFEEMHVDGGVTAPVLTVPEAFLLRDVKLGRSEQFQLYILINNKIEREFQVVDDSTIAIAARTSSTLTKNQTRSILFNTYAFARRNKFGFHLTYIEGDRPTAPETGFDTAYMRSLYEYGYQRARGGQLWMSAPPDDQFLPLGPAPVSQKLVSASK